MLTLAEDVAPIIRNALIIQLGIERLVLVDTQQEAMQLIRADGQVIGQSFHKPGAALLVCVSSAQLGVCPETWPGRIMTDSSPCMTLPAVLTSAQCSKLWHSSSTD